MEPTSTQPPEGPEFRDLEPHTLTIQLLYGPDLNIWAMEIHRRTVDADALVSANWAGCRDREGTLRLLRIYMRAAEDCAKIWMEEHGEDLQELRKLTTEATEAINSPG